MGDNGVGDRLSEERTHLANERTVLAYVRTALALAAGGAAVFQFVPVDAGVHWVAWVLIAAGGVVLGIGGYRFVKVRRGIQRGWK